MAEQTNSGYWKYLGDSNVPTAPGKIRPIDPDQLWPGIEPVDTEVSESHSVPRILTRAEKGQALTHLEMDFNLASLFHKLNTSSKGASWNAEELDEDSDVYYNMHKPSREEEMAGMFATFSYAPVVSDNKSIIQNGFQTIKVQHSTDEIRYKLSYEQIPGNLDIVEDLHVTGSTYVTGNICGAENLDVAKDTHTNTLCVSSSSEFGGDVRVAGTSSFEGDVYVVGNLYVNGVAFGNISQDAYKSNTDGEYAKPYSRGTSTVEISSTQEKEYYTKAEVDKMLADLRAELLTEIHG